MKKKQPSAQQHAHQQARIDYFVDGNHVQVLDANMVFSSLMEL